MTQPDHFFILGNPRSGTSLLRIILHCHSRIVVPPECGFLLWWHSKYATSDFSSNSSLLSEAVANILSSKKMETWKLNETLLWQIIDDHKPVSYTELCDLFYITYAKQQGKNPVIIGDKNNYYVTHTEEISGIYPQAKYIHIIRDPRDVACSYLGIGKLNTKSKYTPNLPQTMKDIAVEWCVNNQQVLSLGAKKTESLLTIRYEDLLKDTYNTLSLICNFLGVAFEYDMLNYHNANRINQIEPPETLDWKTKTLEPVDENNVGKYVSELTTDQIGVIEKEANALMRAFKYL